MLIVPIPSSEVTTRYGGPLHVLQETYKLWEDVQLLDYFLDYQDALEKAMNYLAGSHHEDVDIAYRMILVEYIYDHCRTKLEHGLPMYSEGGHAIIAFMSEPASYQAFRRKDSGDRMLAWLCTKWADSFRTEKNGDRTHAINTVVERLVGVQIPNAQWPSQQVVVEALYGKPCWDIYSTVESTAIADSLWAAGFEPIKASIAKSIIPSSIDIPTDLSM